MTYCFIIICPEQGGHLINEKELNEVYKVFKQFFKDYNKTNNFRKFELLASSSQTLLIKSETKDVHPETDEAHDKENSGYFKKFISLLQNDLSSTRKVSDYSSKIGITARKLTSICQTYTGKSPKEIISESLIAESKRLLTQTSYPIKQIAVQLGFSDQYQFSKYFKKQEKVPPAFYRKRGS